ncbi:MAG: hypothetical protein LBU87_04460 [Lactobacillales bacterium]|jgi:uncharacterized FlgJ-related protein|nr:hypothetical protein [Lactobacillales bacterium]
MKKIILIVLVLVVLGGILGWFFILQKSQTDILLETLNMPRAEKIITPKSAQEVRQAYDKATLYAMDRVFMTRFPDDFGKKGSYPLFQKILTPIILKVNEQIKIERALLLLLDEKMKNNILWNEKEMAFFDRMRDKYQLLSKTIPTQMADLLLRVDVIPTSLPVAQALYISKKDKNTLKHPFGQKTWIDGDTYGYRDFDNLIDAVESYMVELNTDMSYFSMWEVRDRLRSYGTMTGAAMTPYLGAYDLENKNYIYDLRGMYQYPYLNELDNAAFKKDKK